MESAPSQNSTRSHQYVVAAVLLVLLAALGYRAYSPRLAATPTNETTPAFKPVDLNRADRAELVQVPGIGPSLAQAILSHRTQMGRFESLDDLQSVHGIGPKTLEKLRPWLKIDSSARHDDDEQVAHLSRKVPAVPLPVGMVASNKVRAGERIDVNSADEAALQRLPGIGPTLAGRIIAARDAKPFGSVEDLRKVKGIGAKTLENIRPFVTVEAR